MKSMKDFKIYFIFVYTIFVLSQLVVSELSCATTGGSENYTNNVVNRTSVIIFDYEYRNIEQVDKLSDILTSFGVKSVQIFDDSVCDRADRPDTYSNNYTKDDIFISILVSPLLCQSFPEHYIIWRLQDSLEEFVYRISEENAYEGSTTVLSPKSSLPADPLTLGLPLSVLTSSLALWDSDVSTLSEWNALLATHGISFEYVTYLNIESLHHNIHSEDLIRLRDTIIGIAQYVNLSPPIIRREVSDESAQEISQVTSSSRSKIFPCRNPFCEYRCGGSVTSERKPGIGSRLTADKQKSSSRICTATICADISKSFGESYDESSFPTFMTCPGGEPGSDVGRYISSEQFRLHPIGFVSPEDDILDCVPDKVRDFSAIDPADRSTYIYGIQDELEYKRNMAHSRFAYTRKKGGWDAQRHFEIMAAGSIPYFEDIHNVPDRIIPFMPRALLTAAKKFADSSASSFDALGRPNSWQASTFNHTAYNTFACCILRHARDKQTTKSLAEYILRVVNISSIKTVLILGEHPNLDYMAATVIHGLRRLLGDTVVTDYPPNPIYYHVHPQTAAYSVLKSHYIHGLGYTWSHRLRNSSKLFRGEIKRGIEARKWDLVIYPQIHRGMPFWDLVKKHYCKERIVLIDAEDWSASQYLVAEYLHHVGQDTGIPTQKAPLTWPPLNADWRALFHQGVYFKRELDSCPDNSLNYYPRFST